MFSVQVPVPSETVKVEESWSIRKECLTAVGSPSIVVVEVVVAREDSRLTVRVGTVYDKRDLSETIL